MKPPDGAYITWQLQYRKCGKPTCRTCQQGPGHGPYWYAYWHEGMRLRSSYHGKIPPPELTPAQLAQAQVNLEARSKRRAGAV